MEFKHYEIVRIKTSNEDRDLEPHRHLYYELFFFFAGSGEHLIDFKEFDIAPPSIQLVGPHQVHQVKHSKDSEGFVIKIQPHLVASNSMLNDYFNFIQYNQHFKAGVLLNKDEAQLLKQSFLFLETYRNSNSEDSLFGLMASLHLYLSVLKRHQNIESEAENNPNNIHFTTFLALAEANYLIEKNADFYTQQLSISLSKLNNIVRERTGMSVKKFLINRVLLEAKRQIIHSSKSIKEIAYDLDFLEPAHFSNFFKKHLGSTPSKFRAAFYEE